MKRKGKLIKGAKSSASNQSIYSKKSFITLYCSKCGTKDEKCGYNAIGVICSKCVQAMVGPPASIVRANEQVNKIRKPRGWKFMKVFIDTEGNVFHRGIEQPDLKGTLDPTPMNDTKSVKKRKLTPREKEKIEHKKIELYAEIQKIKKSIIDNNLTTRMRKLQEREIKKIEKQISKL